MGPVYARFFFAENIFFGEEFSLSRVVLENVGVNGISSDLSQSDSLSCKVIDITMPKKEISRTIAANSAIALHGDAE